MFISIYCTFWAGHVHKLWRFSFLFVQSVCIVATQLMPQTIPCSSSLKDSCPLPLSLLILLQLFKNSLNKVIACNSLFDSQGLRFCSKPYRLLGNLTCMVSGKERDDRTEWVVIPGVGIDYVGRNRSFCSLTIQWYLLINTLYRSWKQFEKVENI